MDNKKYIDINLGDPAPTDTEARKAYVSQVAGFFKGILEPKINYMISVSHNMLEETTNDRDFDLVVKGVVYSLREFLKWGESMINEQVAYQTDSLTEGDKQLLKDKLKE